MSARIGTWRKLAVPLQQEASVASRILAAG